MMAPQLGFTSAAGETTPSEILADRRAAVFYPQGFLRPGTTQAAAAAQSDALWATLAPDRPLADAGERLESSTSGRRRAAARPTCCRR